MNENVVKKNWSQIKQKFLLINIMVLARSGSIPASEP